MKQQANRRMSGWAAVIVVLASAGSLLAHHSLSQFDTTTAVWMKGSIVRIELINPHSIIFVDQKGADGKSQRWAVEGPGVFQLTRMGIGTEAMKVGDIIEACGYVLKAGIESQRTVAIEPGSASAKTSTPKSMTGRIITGEMLVMPDGRKQRWSDYGQHHCLGSDYIDMHR